MENGRADIYSRLWGWQNEDEFDITMYRWEGWARVNVGRPFPDDNQASFTFSAAHSVPLSVRARANVHVLGVAAYIWHSEWRVEVEGVFFVWKERPYRCRRCWVA